MQSLLCKRLTACLLHNDPASYSSAARLRVLRLGAEAKASPKWATSCRRQTRSRSDLPMGRMKRLSQAVEVRTGER